MAYCRVMKLKNTPTAASGVISATLAQPCGRRAAPLGASNCGMIASRLQPCLRATVVATPTIVAPLVHPTGSSNILVFSTPAPIITAIGPLQLHDCFDCRLLHTAKHRLPAAVQVILDVDLVHSLFLIGLSGAKESRSSRIFYHTCGLSDPHLVPVM